MNLTTEFIYGFPKSWGYLNGPEWLDGWFVMDIPININI